MIVRRGGLSNSDQIFPRQTGMMDLSFATICQEECRCAVNVAGDLSFRNVSV